MDAVTEVLLDRSHDVDRLSRMMLVSLAAHAALIAVVAIAPRFAPDTRADDGPVMTISLAGVPGPVQGRNPQSATPVQEVAAKPKNDTPPALPSPEMVEATAKKPEPKATAKPEPKKDTPQLHGRTPTQGADIRQGTARANTGQTAAVPFGGLATGGFGGEGARTELGDFCCPEYLMTIQRLIEANTNHQQGQNGSITMKFVIQRDGTIADVSAPQGGNQFLELASRRALDQTRKLPPLPAQYTGTRLTVLIDFKFR